MSQPPTIEAAIAKTWRNLGTQSMPTQSLRVFQPRATESLLGTCAELSRGKVTTTLRDDCKGARLACSSPRGVASCLCDAAV